MWYKIIGQGWQYYSKGHKPKFYLKKMTAEEYSNRDKNKDKNK